MKERLSYQVEGKNFAVRLTDEDRRKLEGLMKHYGIPGSATVRLLIRDAAKKIGRKPKAPSD